MCMVKCDIMDVLQQEGTRKSFQKRQHPGGKNFGNIDRRLREFASFKEYHRNGRNHINLNKEEEILQIVTNNPTSSIRRISTICDQSKSRVWNSFHFQKVQELHFNDGSN